MSEGFVQDYHHSLTREDLEEVIVSRTVSPYRKIIYRAIRDYGIRFRTLRAGSQPCTAGLTNTKGPMFTLVDDHTGSPYGRWNFEPQQLSESIDNCIGAAVLCHGHNPDVYTLLSLMSGFWRAPTVIVETAIGHEEEWIEYIQYASPEAFLLHGAILVENNR